MAKVLSPTTKHLVRYLGQMIKIARKEQQMPLGDLSNRMGVSKHIIEDIESGKTAVTIGSYFEAALIVGIPLLGGSREHASNMSKLLSYMNKLIPEVMENHRTEVDDNF